MDFFISLGRETFLEKRLDFHNLICLPTPMNISQAKFIAQIIEDAGESAEIREDYSGRGMFGKTTVGITFDARDVLIMQILINKILQLSSDGPYLGKLPEELDNLRIDSMGQGFIIY